MNILTFNQPQNAKICYRIARNLSCRYEQIFKTPCPFSHTLLEIQQFYHNKKLEKE